MPPVCPFVCTNVVTHEAHCGVLARRTLTQTPGGTSQSVLASLTRDEGDPSKVTRE